MTSTETPAAMKAPWSRVVDTAPEFATRVEALFRAFPNKTLATLRKDGTPRLSAVEVWLTREHAVLILMPQSMKARDVRRDPRVAVLSGSSGASDSPVWPNARLTGTAVPVTDPAQEAAILADAGVPTEMGASGVYLLDLDEVTDTRFSTEAMETNVWKDGQLRSITATS
ncbi:pyridoxamine 5'-phosphate oxidase family protein [Nocardia pseudovaccinii]|uniref:pyridoxamine 5'-phosphate oxidase family protein n=1 Tax=Nocardia pseudovaccinii TaxID=189540 RepID=UPI003D90FDB0